MSAVDENPFQKPPSSGKTFPLIMEKEMVSKMGFYLQLTWLLA
jgi:hypothetical protein